MASVCPSQNSIGAMESWPRELRRQSLGSHREAFVIFIHRMIDFLVVDSAALEPCKFILRHFVTNQDDPVRASESRRAGPATSRIAKCPRPRPDTKKAASTTIGPIPGVATKTRIK